MRTTQERQDRPQFCQHKNMDETSFPLLYHLHHQTYQEDIPFWLELAQEQGDPILELGCGSGRVLLPLAEAGYRLYGLENDPAMLAFLRPRLPSGLAAPIELIAGDLRRFHIPARFALILLPCNTYSTLNARERRSALACIRLHLAEAGLFAVSLPNPELLAQLPPNAEPEAETSFIYPPSGLPVQVSSAWRSDERCIHFDWHYDQLFPDGRVARFTATTSHWRTTSDALLDEFRAAGLAVTAFYGGFDRSRFSSQSSELIILAKNQNQTQGLAR
jgi:SAM-dependent methyltransferase